MAVRVHGVSMESARVSARCLLHALDERRDDLARHSGLLALRKGRPGRPEQRLGLDEVRFDAALADLQVRCARLPPELPEDAFTSMLPDGSLPVDQELVLEERGPDLHAPVPLEE